MTPIEKEIFDKIVLPPHKYQNPFIIALCGYSGSGKTTLSKVFSNVLGAYIVGGDCVRQQLINPPLNLDINEANKVTAEICEKEIRYLVENHVSVIIDKSISSKEVLEYYKEQFNNIIMINLKSNDDENIKRLYMKKEGTNQTYNCDPVYGDSEDYSGMHTNPEVLYEGVKQRKVYDIDEFDYEINTLQSLDKVIEDTKKIAEKIKEDIK